MTTPPSVDPAEIALMLDFDGTLIPYHTENLEAPRVDPALPGLLERLAERTGGATAVVTGRGIAELEALLGPVRLPISGTHGAEFRAHPDSEIELDVDSGGLDRIEAMCGDWVATRVGVTIQRKPLTLVLHFHDVPDMAVPALDFARAVCREVPDYEPQAGRGVVEFKPAGADKGQGVDRVMARPPFSGRVPVFIGDDLPDEAGFAVVNALGGISIRVGVGTSIARYRLADTRAVRAFLESVAA